MQSHPTRSYRTVIDATQSWKAIDLQEILRYRDMLYFRVVSAYKAEHRQMVLSYLWVVIDPLIKIVFCAIVFGSVVRVRTGSIPYLPFNASGMVAWAFVSTCLNNSISSLGNEAILLQKIYFPRIFIPLVPCLAQIPNLLLNLALTIVLLAFMGYPPTWAALLLPVPIILFIILSTGTGLMLSTFALQYRDVRKLWSGLMQFLIYSVPVAYPATAIPEKFRGWYFLNPLAADIETFRACLLNQPIPWRWLALSAVTSLALLHLGGIVFRRHEAAIVDTV